MKSAKSTDCNYEYRPQKCRISLKLPDQAYVLQRYRTTSAIGNQKVTGAQMMDNILLANNNTTNQHKKPRKFVAPTKGLQDLLLLLALWICGNPYER